MVWLALDPATKGKGEITPLLSCSRDSRYYAHALEHRWKDWQLQKAPFLTEKAFAETTQVQECLIWMSLAKSMNVCTHIHPLPNTEKLMGYDPQSLQETDRRREVKVFLLFLFDNCL